MKIQVDYFVDDDQIRDYLEIAGEIRSILRRSADYQHGDLTVSTDVTGSSKDIHIGLYLRDCEDMGHTRNVMSELDAYLLRKCT